MDTMTAPAVAKRLGVSLPTAHKYLDAVGVPRVGRGHTRVVSVALVKRLVAAHGAIPASPLRSTELRALAVIDRSPVGLSSARAVALRAGISPTTAGRAVQRLVALGYLVDENLSAVGGPVRLIATADRVFWPDEISYAVSRTALPEVVLEPGPLPRDLYWLFPNMDGSQLDPARHGYRMARRMLEAEDVRAWRWAMTNIPRNDVWSAVIRGRMSERTRLRVRRWYLRGTGEGSAASMTAAYAGEG